MNQKELIKYVAANSDVSVAVATKAVQAISKGIRETLAVRNTVTLAGLGKFYSQARVAHYGRDVRTGATIRVPAMVVAKFKAAPIFKETLNG